MAGVLGVVAVTVGLSHRPVAPSRLITLLAMLPSVAMLGLFYSLAIHMRHNLGAWPSFYGERGFSHALLTHASIAWGYFSIMFVVGIFVWPVAFLVCLLVSRFRAALFYGGVYALSYMLCFGAMLLAPSQFLNWWWD